MQKPNRQPPSLRFATKHGVHEAKGWLAVLVLALIIIIPVLSALFIR